MPKPEYVPLEDNRCIFRPKPISEGRLDEMRRANNRDGKPVGPFTGRCAHCGSKNLWDDNLAYGCDDCGAILGGN